MTTAVHTTTALRRWSCSNSQLPPVDQIKRIHVYDFDNTLFLSPLPNKQLWNTTTFGALQAQEYLHGGGWWHNNRILASTGQGEEAEEARAWEGSWNEHIVELARNSADDPNALSVLLTGRGEANFSDLLHKIFKAKGLHFDIVALKPAVSPTGTTFDNTLDFKRLLLKDILWTYVEAKEIRMYEDRPKHTKAFRDYFEQLNSILKWGKTSPPRAPFNAEVVQVEETESYMDPVKEVAEVQNMINNHNQLVLDGKVPAGTPSYKISRTVFYTGYMISADDTEKLKELAKMPRTDTDDVKWLANNILITPRPASDSILERVGGFGAVMRWTVTALGQHESRVWAAKVTPTNDGASIYTENHSPYVVLATRRQTKPIEASRIRQWQPVPAGKGFEFDTIVGEKVLLRIEEERSGEDDDAGQRNGHKRIRDDDFPPLGPSRQQHGNNRHNGSRQQQSNHSAWSANRSGGIGFAAQRGGSPGRGGRGSGRGRRGNDRGGSNFARGRGRGAYRSLDANVGHGYGAGGMEY